MQYQIVYSVLLGGGASALKISIIIVNWDGKYLLKKCMPSVVKTALATKETHEIIVVDNGSTDGSVEFLESNYPNVKIVRMERNMGFTKASNAGARAARGDILIFLNNDIMLKSDSLEKMISHFSDKRVFGVSPKLLKWDKKTIQAEFLGCDFVLGTVVQTQPNMNEPDRNEFKEPMTTFFALGGASAIDRRKFFQLEGFDEVYSPFYWEEVDLSYRAYKRGWVCIYEPRAVFYHKHRATLSKNFSTETLQLQELKARFIFTWSNFFDPLILLAHFAFLPLVFLRSAFKTSYRSRRFLDVIAFFQAAGEWRRILQKRIEEKKNAKLSDREALKIINNNKANELAPVRIWKFLGK